MSERTEAAILRFVVVVGECCMVLLLALGIAMGIVWLRESTTRSDVGPGVHIVQIPNATTTTTLIAPGPQVM